MTWDILEGDCVGLMAGMEAGSVDAVVCDPPYGLEFMGKEWDRLFDKGDPRTKARPEFRGQTQHPFMAARARHGNNPLGTQEWHGAWAVEALRVLKPGGHLLAFGGTRTYHRLVCALEDAGFEIRDCLAWLYGMGFPKSHNLSGEWEGWGTALKPAHEPIVLARKPLAGTVAGNVLEHGTGALNVDATRIGYRGAADQASAKPGGLATGKPGALAGGTQNENGRAEFVADNTKGRWPANVILDEQAAAMLDEQTGERGSYLPAGSVRPDSTSPTIFGQAGRPDVFSYGDSGGASRFFYVAKASRAERNAGLEGFEDRARADVMSMNSHDHTGGIDGRGVAYKIRRVKNNHPTVKPVSLMRWLVRLVTPPGGLVLDPFAGSGTTGVAAVLEGFRFLGVEREPEYVELARARVGWWEEHGEDALRIVAERERAEAERLEVAAAGQLELLADGSGG